MSKGSRNRVTDHKRYGENFDGIRWKSGDRFDRAEPKFMTERLRKLLEELYECKRRTG